MLRASCVRISGIVQTDLVDQHSREFPRSAFVLDSHLPFPQPEQLSLEIALPRLGRLKPELDRAAGKALKILLFFYHPVQAGRGNLKQVGFIDRVAGVQQRPNAV